jgi:hypothetical protein
MMGSPAQDAAIAAFEEFIRLMLHCDMNKWRIRGLDGLLALLKRRTRTGDVDIIEEVVGRDWLAALLREVAATSGFCRAQNAATVLFRRSLKR